MLRLKNMPKLLISAAAVLLLLGGAAQAQLAPNVANLPPQGATPSEAPSAIAPSPKYVGPAPGAAESPTFGDVKGPATVTPSPKYVGPALGGPEGSVYATSPKPAGYESDATMHPYSATGMGPKAN
jgi:hypothetical protein